MSTDAWFENILSATRCGGSGNLGLHGDKRASSKRRILHQSSLSLSLSLSSTVVVNFGWPRRFLSLMIPHNPVKCRVAAGWSWAERFRGGCTAFSSIHLYLLLYLYKYTYIYIYIYTLWGYYLVQVWPFWKLLSGPSLFFYKTPIAKKHYKNRGFSPFFLEKKIVHKKFGSYYLVQVGVFKDAVNLDQIITSNLDQIITSKNAIFFVIFCFEKCAKMPIFIVFFEKQPKKCKKKCQKKTITFDILQNTGS